MVWVIFGTIVCSPRFFCVDDLELAAFLLSQVDTKNFLSILGGEWYQSSSKIWIAHRRGVARGLETKFKC